MAEDYRQRDDFRGVVRVLPVNGSSEALKTGRCGFDNEQHFPAAVEVTLPPKKRFQPGHNVHAGRQPFGDHVLR